MAFKVFLTALFILILSFIYAGLFYKDFKEGKRPLAKSICSYIFTASLLTAIGSTIAIIWGM